MGCNCKSKPRKWRRFSGQPQVKKVIPTPQPIVSGDTGTVITK